MPVLSSPSATARSIDVFWIFDQWSVPSTVIIGYIGATGLFCRNVLAVWLCVRLHRYWWR
jgi:hypothetical protein